MNHFGIIDLKQLLVTNLKICLSNGSKLAWSSGIHRTNWKTSLGNSINFDLKRVKSLVGWNDEKLWEDIGRKKIVEKESKNLIN